MPIKPSSVLSVTVALGSFLVPVASRAADNWVEVRSPHFTVNSNASEKEARKIADQFEQMRRMFLSAFGTLRVDPPQPIVILAAKNENTMKLFLPEEWEAKGHIHHAGLYQPGQDKDYVLMRLDSEEGNPFHTLYHEYTHALLRLNFSNLPLWLDEGLAEFFGSSTLGDKESKTGTIDPGHLYLLQQSKLIPIENLLEVDHRSPFYNETNRASVFYAESWALVHYLQMDKEARQKQLLKNFLAAWEQSGDQVQAAQTAFGDLKQFGKKIESYARQSSFQIGLVKAGLEAAEKNYNARALSPAEALALRGDFFAHHNRVDEAQAVLQEALKAEPNLAFAHEALSYYHYRRHEIEEADEEIMQALKLGAAGFAPQYFHGFFLIQRSRFSAGTAEEAKQYLQKAIQLNPQFAPAYEGLSQTYVGQPNFQKEAVNAAIKAVQLDPSQHAYAVNLAYLLLNSGRFAEARTMAQRILAVAASPAEKQMANNLLQNIQQAQEWSARKQSEGAATPTPSDSMSPDSVTDPTKGQRPAGTDQSQSSLDPPIRLRRRGLGVDGPISSVDCSAKPEVFLNLNLASGPVTLHAADIGKIPLRWANGTTELSASTCSQWKGRRVKVWFSPTPGKEYAGEITELDFF